MYLGIQRILATILKVWNYIWWLHGLNFGTLLYNVIQIKKLSISMMEWHWEKWLLILHIISYLYCNHGCRWHSGKRIRLPIQEMQETRVRSLELGRSPGKGNGYHSSIRAWRIPWTEEPGVHGVAKSQTRLSTHFLKHDCRSHNEVQAYVFATVVKPGLRLSGVMV